METLQTETIRKINASFYNTNPQKKSRGKILFLGETFRADAQTWMNGLIEFGDFEIITWELNQFGVGFKRMLRHVEFLLAPFSIRKLVREEKPDMVIAERTTSYGFLAALSGVKPMAVAQQGITDIYPLDSPILPLKESLQNYAFKKATLIHAWGPAMANTMMKKVDNMDKVMIMPKGINLNIFKNQETPNRYEQKIRAIVTRSLLPDYKHNCIIRAFHLLKKKGYDVELLIAGQGPLKGSLVKLCVELKLEKEVVFLGSINNLTLPKYLNRCNLYVSMPVTEGVSASLFEAMACGLYPIVSDLPGNQSWIKHGENGHLVPVNDYNALCNSIEEVWKQPDLIKNAVTENRIFIEENANYAINMKRIADKYQELINDKIA